MFKTAFQFVSLNFLAPEVHLEIYFGWNYINYIRLKLIYFLLQKYISLSFSIILYIHIFQIYFVYQKYKKFEQSATIVWTTFMVLLCRFGDFYGIQALVHILFKSTTRIFFQIVPFVINKTKKITQVWNDIPRWRVNKPLTNRLTAP